MKLLKKCIATNGLLLLAFWLSCSIALAAPVVGTVTQLSGPLLAKKATGTVKILSLKSEVENGDTLVSEKNTYAQVRMIDNSELTLKPGTTVKIDNFVFENDKPDNDSANFSLVKGGMRSVSGLLGKRNKEKFALKTPAATIGIRGTTFIVDYVPPLGERSAAAPPGVPDGLHLQVLDGQVFLFNQGGSLTFSPGQFGYVPNMAVAPVVVPQDPGLKFTPPPAFNQSTAGPESSAAPAKSNTVDCEVR